MPTGQYPRKNPRLQYLIEALLIQTDECQIWPFQTATMRYGFVQYEGESWNVHRLAMKLTDPSFNDALQSLHNCPNGDNPLCFNPRHLWQGTQKENLDDMVHKGRMSLYPAILKSEHVPLIRHRRLMGETIQKIADDYGVGKWVIWRVIHRKTWKHIA